MAVKFPSSSRCAMRGLYDASPPTPTGRRWPMSTREKRTWRSANARRGAAHRIEHRQAAVTTQKGRLSYRYRFAICNAIQRPKSARSIMPADPM